MITVESTSPHDDCVSLNADDSLSDVGSGLSKARANDKSSFIHDGLEGTSETYADDIIVANTPLQRENPLGRATDILLSVESHDNFSVGYLISVLFS